MTRKGDFSERTKFMARSRANWTCETPNCDESAFEADHIKELWEGGDNTLSNCQILCRKCHAEKSAKNTKRRAKADRQGGKKGQFARRKKAKAEGRYKPIAGRKLESRNEWPKGRKLKSRKMGAPQ